MRFLIFLFLSISSIDAFSQTITVGSTSVCLGSSVSLTANNVTCSYIQYYQYSTNGGSSWTNISGFVGNCSASHTPSSPGSYIYRYYWYKNNGQNGFSTNSSTVTAYSASVGGTLSGVSSSICINSSTGTMTLTGYTGTILRWERNRNSAGWENAYLGTNNTASENPYSSGTWQYRVVVQNGSCAIAYSSVFSITVSPTSVGGWITTSNSNSVCLGSSIGTLTLNGSTGSILRWEKRVDSESWTNITNTTTTYTETPTTSGTWEYRALVQSGSCASAYSSSISRTVNPSATITLGQSPVICRGTTTAQLPYTGTTGNPTSYSIDFDATANAAGFGDFSNYSLPASPISLNVPWNVTPGTYNGSITVGSSGCSGAPSSFTITVNSLPTLTGASQASTVCSGSTANINLSGLLPNTTSTVNYKINGVDQSPATGIVSDGSGNASFQTTALTSANNGQTLQITGITTTSYTPSCTQTFSRNVTLSVSAAPNLSGLNTNATNVCTGNASVVTISATSLPNGTYTVNYTLTGTNPQGATNTNMTVSSGNTGTFNTPVLATAGSTTVTVNSLTLNSCTTNASTGNTASITITALPNAAGNITGSSNVSPGQTGIAYSVASVTNATSYSWVYSGTGATINGTTNNITIDFSGSATSGDLTVSGVNSCGTGTASANFPITVGSSTLSISTTQTDIACVGQNDGTITASGSGGQPPYQYKLNSGTYQTSGSFTNLAADTYSVWVRDNIGTEVSTSVIIDTPSSSDNQASAGSDSWIGHVYKRLDAVAQSPSDIDAFSQYVGNMPETETFDQDFGGNTNCFTVYSSGSPFCSVEAEYFAVRYRMNSTKTGIYVVNIGSDDGIRLTVDGIKVHDNWVQRGYVVDSQVLFELTGASNLLYEYFESSGGNRVSFSSLTKIPNSLSGGTSQTICQGESLSQITGNNASTDAPISGSGSFTVTYQWQQASSASGPWSDISGATSQNYTPVVSSPGTYYFRRKLTVSKTNPGSINVTANDVSSVATVTINPLPDAAGNITGTSSVTPPQTGLAYSVAAIANATSYSWAYSGTGATINGTTNSVTIDFASNATSGNLTVQGANTCGNGTVSPTFPITVNQVCTYNFNASDDAEENYLSDGSVDLTSTDLELPRESEEQLIGIRFTNVSIPQGSLISAAYIQFTVDETSSGSVTLDIYGEDTDNASAYTTATNNISGRIKTTASSSWSPADWNSAGANGTDQQTSDIKSIIQEIVDRPGWTSGNSIGIMIQRSTSDSGTNTRIAESTNGTADPQLVILIASPDAAGSITGLSSVAQGQNAVVYSIDPISGATGYTWSYSGTGATINNGTTNSITIDFSSDATSGNLSVYGSNICENGSQSDDYAITVIPNILSISSTQDVSCYGSSDGQAVVEAVGGTPPYDYEWRNSSSAVIASTTNTSSTTDTQTGLSPDTYTVTLTDDNDIEGTVEVIISEPAEMSASVSGSGPGCGSSDGSIAISGASGGSGTYEYSINGGSSWQSSGNFTGLSSGTYDIRIRDAANTSCEKILNSSFVLSEALAVPLSADTTSVLCPSSTTGAIDLSLATPISFDGSDYIDLGGSFMANLSSFTLEGWIRVDVGTLGSRMSLFGQNDAIEFGFSDSNTMFCWTASGGSVSVPVSGNYPSDNQWHHVAVVGNGTNLILYIDGSSVATGGSTTGNYGNSTSYTPKIGGGVWDATGGTFSGEIIKTGFWNTALSTGEIANLASEFTTYTGLESGLIAGYNFFEGSGSTLNSSPTGQNGTFSDSPTWENPYTYSWTKTGDTNFSETTQDLSNIGPGTYNVNVTNTVNGCNSVGSWTIDYTDSTNPAITCPANQTRSANSGINYTVAGTEFDPVALTDNCSVSAINDFNGLATLSGAEISDGTTITWTATDESGNVSQCSFNVTVNPPDYIATINANDNSATEGGDDAQFTVSLDAVNSTGNNLTIDYNVSGTATSGTDYSSLSGSVIIPNGSQTALIDVTGINDDALDEDNETVIVTLVAGTGYVLGSPSEDTVIIIDNDPEPSVTLATDFSTINEDAGVAIITATLSSISGKDVTVNLGFSGTATGGGTDYTTSGNSILISAGNPTGTITVTGVDDVITESNETIVVDINTVTNGLEDGTQQETITIIDDDIAGITINPTSGLVTTETGGQATFTVVLNTQPSSNVTIGLSSSDTSEGTVSPSSLVFTDSDWSNTQTVTITGVNDATIDGDVAYTIITATANSSDVTYNGMNPSDVSVTNIDDDGAPLGSIAVNRISPQNTYDAEELVQNVLVQGCLTASNITFTGNSSQIGHFTKGSSSFPIEEGIILSTGNVADAEGPNYDYNTTTQYGGSGDSQLNSEAGLSSSNDAAILEFDFVPAGDMIEFNYVFASEEYAEFVGEQYNDAFAFFLSGPGITGTENIALIPGTSTPVAINNIHGQGATLVSGYPPGLESQLNYPTTWGHTYSGDYYGPWTINPTNNSSQPPLNSSYYVDNGHFTDRTDGTVTWTNGNGSAEMEFDGRTTLLTASHSVNPCETYHIKIVIADAVDQKWDSGVFLEGRSFTSNEVQISSQIEGISGDADDMYEGCDGSFIRFQRAAGADNSQELNFPIIISGTATNGVDFVYTNSGGTIIGDGTFPSSATLVSGVNYVDYYYKAQSDGVIEGNETVIFKVNNSCPCDVTPTYFEKTVTIIDVPQIVTSTTEVIQCQAAGNPVATITVNMENGLNSEDYEFSLDGGAFQASNVFTITATQPDGSDIVGTSHYVTVRDQYSCNEVTEYNIIIPEVAPFDADAGTDITMCEGQSGIQLNGSGGIYYSWTSVPTSGTTYLSSTTVSNPTVLSTIPAGTYTFTVTSQDQPGASPACQGTDDMILTVNQRPSVTVTANDYTVCNGTSVQLNASVTNGGSNPTYSWNPDANLNNPTISNPVYTPDISSYLSQAFTVTVTGDNGCFTSASTSIIEVFPNPVITTTNITNASCPGDNDGSATVSASSPGTSPAPSFTYQWDASAGNQTGATATGLTAGTYTVTVSDNSQGCSNTHQVTIGTDPDTTDPTPVCQNAIVTLDGTGNATITTEDIDNGSTDNCTSQGNLILSLDKTIFNTSDVGQNTVTLTVEDEAGNTATCQATVTVNYPASCIISGSTTIWLEDFSGYPPGTTDDIDGSPNDWSTSINDASRFSVQNEQMRATNTDQLVSWLSEPTNSISISGWTNLNISVDLPSTSGIDANEYIRLEYNVDGSGWVQFDNNGYLADDYSSLQACSGVPDGSLLQIRISMISSNGVEFHYFDNVHVTGDPNITINSVPTNVSCNGADDGSITVNASGAFGPYQYKLDAVYTSYQSSNVFNNLPPGTYTVTVQGTHPSITIEKDGTPVTITEPAVDPTLQQLAVSDATSCSPAGGNVSFTITNSQNGVHYELKTTGGASLSPAVTATGTGSNLNLTILQANVPTTTTTYKVVATSSSGCTTIDLTDQPTLTVYNTPAPTGSTSQSFCSSSTPRISNISVSGTGIIWYNAPTNGSILSTNTLLVNGTTYYASQTQNGCESQSRLAVTVTVTQTPTILTVTHGDICGSGSTTLHATASSGTIHWYSAQTGGTDLGTGTSFTTPTISTTTSYWVSATNNGCTTLTRSEVIARVNTIPSVTLGSSPVACNGATSANLTYSSPAGNPNRYSINFDGTAEGQGFVDVTEATLPSSPIIITVPGAAPAGVYNATISFKNSTSGCISPDYPFTVTLSANTAITTQPTTPSDVCENSGLATISVVASGGNLTYQWYVDGTTPLTETTPYSGVNSEILTITNPAISLNGKQYTVKVSGSCGPEVTSNAVTLTVTARPSAPTGSATQSFCSADSPTVANISVTGSNIIWYDAASGGNTVAGSTSLVNGTTYYASQTENGCESTSRLAVTVTVNTTPSAPTGSASQSFCSADSPTVTDISVTGSNIIWYDASSGGSTIAGSTSLVNGTTYYASQTVNGCESASRLAVTVTVNTTPSAPTGSANQSFCSADSPTVADISITGSNIIWYDASSGGSTVAGSTSLVNGTTYYASQTENGCESTSRLAVTVTVNTTPSAPTGTATQSFCSADSPTVSNISITGSNIIWYDAPSGGSTVTGSTPLVNGTTYYASQTENGCESTSRLAVTVTVNTTVTAGVSIAASPSFPICAGTSVSFTATPVNGGTTPTYQWYNGSEAISGETASTYTSSSLSDGDVISVQMTSNAPCVTGSPATSNTVTVSTTGLAFEQLMFIDETCYGENSGKILIELTGGTPAYSISVLDGSSTQVATYTAASGEEHLFTNLAPDTYTVNITDNDGCPISYTGLINAAEDITISLDSSTDNACYEDENGTIDISVSGGTQGNYFLFDENEGSGTDAGTRIDVPYYSNLSIRNSGTLECWVKFRNSPQNYAVFIIKGNTEESEKYSLQLFNKQLCVTLHKGTTGDLSDYTYITGGTNPFPTGEWHHVAGTWDVDSGTGTGNMYLYMDGVQLATTSITTSDLPNTTGTDIAPLMIGRQYTNSSDMYYRFDGYIREVRVWDYQRSKVQIQSTMYSSLSGSETGLVAYLPIQDGTGTTIANEVSGANDGTVANGSSDYWESGYQYSWTGPDDYTATTEDLTNLATGQYTITVTDVNNCSKTAQYEITSEDETAPVFSPGTPTSFSANTSEDGSTGDCQYTLSSTNFDILSSYVTDDCNFIITHDYTENGHSDDTSLNGAIFDAGTHTITWTASDLSGNSTTHEVTITIPDDENPVATCETTDQTVNVDSGECTYTHSGTAWDATATDNCNVAGLGYELTGTTTGTGTSLNTVAFNPGITTVTWTATDDYGNTNTCSYTVTVSENLSISAQPQDQTVCEGNNATFSLTASGTSGTPTYQWQLNTGSGFADISGETSATLTLNSVTALMDSYQYRVIVAGACGTDNLTSDIATLTVNPTSVGGTIDGSASVCYGTNSTSLTLSGNTGAVIKWQYSTNGSTWTDISNTTTSYTATNLTVTTQYRTVIQSGICDETYSSVATVTIDETDPVILNCPDNITVNVDAGLCSAVVSWTAPTANDNCAIQSFTSNYNPGASFATGITTVTYTATDTNGNTAICSFTVTVNDNENPVIGSCPSNTTVSTLNDVPDPVTTASDIATDNCGLSTISNNDVTSLTCPRTITRTYTVTDINGNQATCQQVITITNAPCIDASLCTTTSGTNLISGSPSSGTGTLYSQAISVCSSTTYEVKFDVSGTSPYDFDIVLDSDYVNDDIMYNSGSTYGFKFKTASSSSSVSLSIINNDTNSLTISNLSFAHCGPTVSAAITTQPECAGSLAELTATVTGSGSYVYQWEVSSNGGSSWSDLTNGATVSGATGTVLSFTSWSESNIYRIVVSETPAGLDETDCSIQSNTISISPSDSDPPVYQEAFKNTIDPVHSGGNYTYTACDDGTNIFSFLALDATDVVDNCSAFGDLSLTYSITNGINDITNANGDASTYSFPVGSSSVIYEAEDENGNVGNFTFTVVVNQNPVLTDISTDGTISADASGYRPYQGSSHTYTVDGGTATPGSIYTWKVLDKNDTELTAGNANTYLIYTTNPAAVVISWGGSIPLSENNYKIVVRETNSTSGCYTEKELTVTILENTFNATVVDAGNECQSGDTGTSVASWTINKTGGATNWVFDYEIKVGPATVYSASGVSVSGATTSIEYIVSNEAGVDKSYTFIISNVYDEFNTPETNLTDNEDTIILWGVPNTSEITTD